MTSDVRFTGCVMKCCYNHDTITGFNANLQNPGEMGSGLVRVSASLQFAVVVTRPLQNCVRLSVAFHLSVKVHVMHEKHGTPALRLRPIPVLSVNS